MKNLHAMLLVAFLASVSFGDQRATAQETVTYRPPARDFGLAVYGEHITYLPDGGCMCQPEDARRIGTTEPCNAAAACGASRTRTRINIGRAIDGGALER